MSALSKSVSPLSRGSSDVSRVGFRKRFVSFANETRASWTLGGIISARFRGGSSGEIEDSRLDREGWERWYLRPTPSLAAGLGLKKVGRVPGF